MPLARSFVKIRNEMPPKMEEWYMRSIRCMYSFVLQDLGGYMFMGMFFISNFFFLASQNSLIVFVMGANWVAFFHAKSLSKYIGSDLRLNAVILRWHLWAFAIASVFNFGAFILYFAPFLWDSWGEFSGIVTLLGGVFVIWVWLATYEATFNQPDYE